ncbi:MAG: hypothetical protein ACJAQW_000467 [Paracoccaceae bacterium]|jgi:hypothetical protein
MIWRRVLVSSSTSLRELHGILQAAMGWDGIHLFQFDVRAVCYGSWELHAADPDISLSDFGLRPVIPPFLAGCGRRTHAAIFSFCAG